jgi:hypothetical protein
MTDTTSEALRVEGAHTTYVIEPIRFRLGLSRVEMVDDHLATLTRDRPSSPDVDALLDARVLFGGAA